MDPDSDPDAVPSIFIIDLQDAIKKLILKTIFCISQCGTAIQRKPLYTGRGLTSSCEISFCRYGTENT
jgi:hypothetical protein